MFRIKPFSYEHELNKAKTLLDLKTENNLPENVIKILEFCTSKEIGFILSRNDRALSCKDARSKRFRLGHVGIPLFDEMKSVIFKGQMKDKREIVIATHCRGHMNIIEETLVQLCGLDSLPQIMDANELMAIYGMDFGTVNPFLMDINSNESVLHIFDVGLIQTMSLSPKTMMTNAGEHTWGIEFDPKQAIATINNKMVDAIAKLSLPVNELDFYDSPIINNPKSIGIITGNGPDSGIMLWSMINNNIVKILGKHFRGDISFPKVNVISLPEMGLSMELDKRQYAVKEAIVQAINSLKDVDVIALACHTTHHFTEQIREAVNNDNQQVFISMSENVIEYISKMEQKHISLLGIDYVADLMEYSAYSHLKDLNVASISADVLAHFHSLAYEVKKKSNLHRAFQKFVKLIDTYVPDDKTVVIALTELSLLYQQFKKDRHRKREVIDSLELYAEKIAMYSLGL